MPSEIIFLDSIHNGTSIETQWTYKGAATEAPAIIIAHPYGPLGGNFHNNVVMALHQLCADNGFLAVSINFRGCGHSKGKPSWTGMPERGDYQSVVDAVTQPTEKTQQFPRARQLVICGYSFGAMVASSIDVVENIPCSYLLISYPLSVTWALATVKTGYFRTRATALLQQRENDVLVIFGSNDQFTGKGSYEKWLQHKSERVRTVLVPGADHFWMATEPQDQLVRAVNDWLSRTIKS
ncbi:Alpha/Beta hydrolase protein [Radiomyces spectabilis]|uniref:Alpha/Beta hydrolase protein n=1 Tax=Radiomyces spectabilis TaxID=64574 RepID=UPI0022203ACB|nr:Alpha/Beta hydrolase protein [Radiomyces spectabilis]KAI8370337.1 Alpha/Beta hydrolase protein [Radiomyces spectabilis]